MIGLFQGAKIIVFPEYGVTGGMSLKDGEAVREAVYPYAEFVPSVSTCLGCTVPVGGSEAVSTLACMAKTYQMYVVGNMIERVTCSPGVKGCRPDGQFLYNTNVVFNQTGCLVAKYHKFAMWAEENYRLDHPAQPEYVYFDTEFGRFGTEVCFDLMFKYPGLPLVQKYDIDTMLFPTYWPVLNSYVSFISNVIQFSSGWARRMHVNFLAADVHSQRDRAIGSAISTPESVVASYCDWKSNQGRLLVADIPINTSKNRSKTEKVEEVKVDEFRDYGWFPALNVTDLQDFVFKEITGLTGMAQVCSHQLCCSANYTRRDNSNFIVIGARASKGNKILPFDYEVCVVRKCKSPDLMSCLDMFDTESTTYFDKLTLSGKFSVDYVYPAVTLANNEYTGVKFDFHYQGFYNELNVTEMHSPLLTAALISYTYDPSLQSHNI